MKISPGKSYIFVYTILIEELILLLLFVNVRQPDEACKVYVCNIKSMLFLFKGLIPRVRAKIHSNMISHRIEFTRPHN